MTLGAVDAWRGASTEAGRRKEGQLGQASVGQEGGEGEWAGLGEKKRKEGRKKEKENEEMG